MTTENLAGVWFLLALTDMRAAPAAPITIVARSRTREPLEQLLERERVEAYVDGQWGKTFRRGGPLEWKHDPELDRFCGIAEVYAIDVPRGGQIVRVAWVAEVPSVELVLAPLALTEDRSPEQLAADGDTAEES